MVPYFIVNQQLPKIAIQQLQIHQFKKSDKKLSSTR